MQNSITVVYPGQDKTTCKRRSGWG